MAVFFLYNQVKYCCGALLEVIKNKKLCRVIVFVSLFLRLLCFIFHLLCRSYKLAGFLSVGGALGFLTNYQVLLCNAFEDHQSLVHSALLAYSKVIAKKRN